MPPEANPDERVRRHLHDQITRNHHGKDLQELLDPVIAWLVHSGIKQRM